MKQEFYTLEITTSGQKLYEFKNKTIDWINKLNLWGIYSKEEYS